jgi:hypothetical protein
MECTNGMSEKSILFKLLQLFSELYPAWRESLIKNEARKKDVAAGYKRVIADITDDHLMLLDVYLRSGLNTEYQKYPPAPLELRKIFDMEKKKLRREVNYGLSLLKSNYPGGDTNNLGYWSAQVFFCSVPLHRIPGEFREYIEKMILWKNNALYPMLCRFHLLFCSLYDQYNQKHTVDEIFDYMTQDIRREWLLEELGAESVDLLDIQDFFLDTRIDEKLYEYFQRKQGKNASVCAEAFGVNITEDSELFS